MGLGKWGFLMIQCIEGIGTKTKCMEKEDTSGLMVIIFREIISLHTKKEKENIISRMWN